MSQGWVKDDDASTAEPETPLESVVDALTSASARFPSPPERRAARRPLPARETIAGIVDDLRAVLFPRHFGVAPSSPGNARFAVGARLERVQGQLTEQVWRGLALACVHLGGRDECAECFRRARDVARAFVTRLPSVRALLESDVRAAYEGDPAARSIDETLLCYPGVQAITLHRIAHELQRLEVPLVPRMISELSRERTGIDIHPGAQIGASFFIDHGTGVVIGETCVLGARVRLYQGVTLGARGFPSDDEGVPLKGLPRHPLVEDDVVIYAGATILGRITIGKGATIGGNAWLTRDVTPGARVTQARPPALEDGAGG